MPATVCGGYSPARSLWKKNATTAFDDICLGGLRVLRRNGLLYFFRCPETNLVISNMLTCFLPLKTA